MGRHVAALRISGARQTELIEEFTLELEEHYERACGRGLNADEAWADVTRKIHWDEIIRDLESVLPECTTPVPGPERKDRMLSDLTRDIRYALRMLVRNKGFAATAVLTIALGIGPNTAIFSMLYAVFWAPTGIPNGDRMAVLWSTHGVEQGFGTRGGIHVSPREYLFWKTQSTTLEDFTAIVQDQVTLADGEYPERIQIQSFTPGHVTLNGGHFMLSRDFLPEEGMSGKEHVVVLSNQFWRRRHNSDPDVIGKSLRLNGIPYTIVGVLAPGWWDRRREPLWPALVVDPQQPGVDRHTLTVQATRRPGVTTAQAQAEMNAISTRLAERYPQLDGWGVRVDERRNSWLNDRTATNLWLLMGSVSLVLLIACFNVANLMLARSGTRLREIAVRLSLGATRQRIFRQILTESVILAILGGFLGVLFSLALQKVFLALAPPFSIPPTVYIHLSGGAMLFTCASTAAAAILFGCAPAWQLARQSVSESLKQGGQSALGRGRHALGKLLIVAEIGLALSLLAGAGLVLRSYWNRTHRDFGVRADHVLTFELPFPRGLLTSADRIVSYNRVLLEKLQAIPEVVSAAGVNGIPLAGSGAVMTVPASMKRDTRTPYQTSRFRMVSPGFFETFGINVQRGRRFTEGDQLGTQQVAMVNEAFARRYLKDLDPLTQELLVPTGRAEMRLQIVGIYRDIENGEQFGGAPRPEMIVPAAQLTAPFGGLAVRTAGDPEHVARSIAKMVHDIDPALPVTNVRTLEQIVGEQTAFDRFEAALYGSFAALALLLATVGIYGLMAFLVAQRRSELGVRMALGANRGDIVRLIVSEGVKLTVAGLLFGIAGAWYAGHVLQARLYGSSAGDPTALAGVIMILLVAAGLACFLPARKAGSIDPLKSLREE